MKTVLFLCTGNYYRSRVAEILFNSVAGKLGLPWRAISRGLALERGIHNAGPMDAAARKLLHDHTITAAGADSRQPLQATEVDFLGTSWIVALKEAEHLPLLRDRFPDWAAKVEFWEVNDDPTAFSLIEQEVMDLTARLIGGGRRRQITAVPATALNADSTVPASPAQKPATLKVGRETAGRKGKGVTTIFDVPTEVCLKELAAKIKQKCGTGGTVKDNRIEIQGDQRERIVAELERLGYKVKRVGG
ncbi:MAG: hypothetical protein AB7O62_18975 [Pirellulales bacterium]